MENVELFITTVFMGFLAMANPLATASLFIHMSSDVDSKAKKSIALKAVIVSFFIVALFAILGEFIFSIFQITLPAFRIVGGLLLIVIGYQNLSAKKSKSADSYDKIDHSSLAVTPLAFPMMAGPGTLSATMNFTAVYTGYYDMILIIFIYAVICLITYFILTNAEKMIRLIGESSIYIITKLLSLIICVIGMQMLIYGIATAFNINTQ